MTGDGSYAIFKRFNDLANGESDNFEWFYAAGEVGDLGEIVEEVEEAAVPGCPYIDACNYSPDAEEDDGSCVYAEENFDCDGNCTVDIDCNGDCAGTATEDECGVCGGDNTSCADCTGVPLSLIHI